MTPKEAVRLLRDLPTMCDFTDAYGTPIGSDAYYEAIDMAISALQVKKTCGDVTSRQTAIEEETKMSEIKICPYCGGQPKVGVEFYESIGSEVWLKAEVRCERCNVGRSVIFKATEITLVPFERYTDAFSKAIRRWNRRVEDNE